MFTLLHCSLHLSLLLKRDMHEGVTADLGQWNYSCHVLSRYNGCLNLAL